MGQPAIDVASIHPNTAATHESSISGSDGRVAFTNVSVRELVMSAFAIPTGREYELQAPEWLNDVKFDIAATFPPETSRDAIRQMLGSLLAVRIDLKTHDENKKQSAYAIVVAKHGPKLHSNSAGTEPSIEYSADHISGRALTIEDLADRLSGAISKLDRPVMDQTGLRGRYGAAGTVGLRLLPKNVPSRFWS